MTIVGEMAAGCVQLHRKHTPPRLLESSAAGLSAGVGLAQLHCLGVFC